jgi:hypothetical protein
MLDRLVKKPERICQKKRGEYYEGHHIIPKSKGGTGNSNRPKNNENIVLLTPREHFLAHWLLLRIHQDRSSAFAFHKMLSFNRNQKRVVSSRGYEEAREVFRKYNIGNKHGKGKVKVVSEEQKKKQSEAMKGRYKGKLNPFFGKNHTEETKEKIRSSRKGVNKEKIWNYGGKKILLKNNEIIGVFDSSEEISKFIGCSHSNVRHVLSGNQRTAKGFEIKHFKEYYQLLK